MKLGIREQWILDQLLLNKSILFFEEHVPFQNWKKTIYSLKKKGYLIRYYKHWSRKTTKIKTCKFLVIFYSHKSKNVIDLIYNKFPYLSSCPGHMRSIEVPICRNLNNLGSIYQQNNYKRIKKNKLK